MKRFENKVALVTASSTGIGFGISRQFALEGATVIISSRNQKNVEEAVKLLTDEGLKAVAFPCNVGSKEDRDSLLQFIKEKFGRLDVLVNNAAAQTKFGGLFKTTESDYDKTFEINVKGGFFMSKEYHTIMPEGSSILFITSYVGYTPDKIIGIYSISKTALLGLIKVMAKELQDLKIRVNGIAPGLIRTQFAAPLLKYEEKILKNWDIDRVGRPDDIGHAAAYLCSKDAEYVNGETLSVTGFIAPRL